MEKAQAKITDSLFLVIATASFIAIMFFFITQSFNELAKQMASDSAEVVAKDLAGFITVSGASPMEMTITYKPSTVFTYNIEVKDRIVKASSMLDGKSVEGPRFFGMEIPAIWMDKTAVGDLHTGLSNVKTIEIQKSVSDGKYVYKILKND